MTKTRSGNGIEIEGKKKNKTEDMTDVSLSSACGKCKQTPEEDIAMHCDGFCKNLFHPACVDINNEDFAVINDLSDHIKWFCPPCRNKLDMILNKSSKLNDSCDWPSILNIVLDQMEQQSQSNLDLSKRINELGDQYQKVSDKLADISSKYEVIMNYVGTAKPILDVSQSTSTSTFAKPESSEPYKLALKQNLRPVPSIKELNRPMMEKPKQSSESANRPNLPTNAQAYTTDSFENYELDSSDDSSPWLKVTSKKTRSKAAPKAKNENGPQSRPTRRLIVGKAELTTGSNIQVAQKTAWIYITRIGKNTTADDILAYVKSTFGEANFTCDKLPTRYPDYSSFKIGAPGNMEEELLDSNKWFRGVLVGKYYPPRSKSNPPDQKSEAGSSDSFLAKPMSQNSTKA